MKIEKERSGVHNLFDISLIEDEKILTIFYAGNLDVYWYFYERNSDERSGTFEITRENYQIYSLFDELYNSVKNVEIFEITQDRILACTSVEELENLKNEIKEMNSHYKYISNWDKLYKDEIITWNSDEFPENNVKIIKKEDKYILRFTFTDEYYTRSIRFRNCGSFYNPFNMLFMRMYNKLQEIDPEDKQIHIEEYLYEKKLLRKQK